VDSGAWGVIVGCHDGQLIFLNVEDTLAETRTWIEIMRAAEHEQPTRLEEVWNVRVKSLFENESWMVFGAESGDMEMLDFRPNPEGTHRAVNGRLFNEAQPEGPLHDNPVVAAGVLPDGRLFSLSSGKPNKLVVFDPNSGDINFVESGPQCPELKDPALFLVLRDGRIVIATESKEYPLISWNTNSGDLSP
jgi:hypothetical protein